VAGATSEPRAVTADGESAPEPCEFLPWDTEHFGLRIGHVREHRLWAAQLRDVLAWAQDESIDCLYLLADAADPETQRLAQGHGFRYVDVRMTLAMPLTEDASDWAAQGAVVRSARAADAKPLATIARSAHCGSRFYADGRFARASVDRLYEQWLVGSLHGLLADVVLVAEDSGEPVGYLTARLDHDQQIGNIELVGTSPRVRRQGFGRVLVSSALRELAGFGMATGRVVTQGRNVAAQRLYQKCGFRTEMVQLWYHRWSDEQLRHPS
jgi:dTDP-4-amino-4,6-dideoxy-D-galactose acyltransferase